MLNMTNEEYIKKYQRYLKLGGKSVNTARDYIPIVEKVFKFTGKVLSKITRDDLEDYIEYLQDKGLKATTINKHISAIQSFYHYTNKSFGIEDISLGLPRPSLDKKEKKLFSKSDIENILNECDLEFRCYTLLGCEAGMRISEYFMVSMDSIDWDKNLITIKSKRKKERLIPMTDNVRESLLEWIELNNIRKGLLFSRNTMFVGRRYKKIFDKIGLKWGANGSGDYSTHSYRHYFITCLAHAKTDVKTISSIVGTSPKVIIENYVHDTNEVKQNAISIFN